jgi:hypothetical protein
MLGWVVGGAGTFVVSLVLAWLFLQIRCQGVGPPFGPRARPWAAVVIVGTALVSTGFGLLLLAASHHPPVAYVGIVVPGGLWLTSVSPPRDRPGALAARLKLPLSRLYDGMGEDMQAWCDIRHEAAAEKPQWISDAAKYYFSQVEGRLKDARAQAELREWRDSIAHKIAIVRLIHLDTTQDRVRDSLQKHASTRNTRGYADDDLPRLARRLESEALNELNLFLATVYRLGHRRLLIYPFRPSIHRAPGSGTYEPGPRKSGTPEPGRRET